MFTHGGNILLVDLPYFFLIREITQSRMMAPMIAVIIWPTMVEPQWIPSQPRTLPPMKPPTIPTRRLIQNKFLKRTFLFIAFLVKTYQQEDWEKE